MALLRHSLGVIRTLKGERGESHALDQHCVYGGIPSMADEVLSEVETALHAADPLASGRGHVFAQFEVQEVPR